MKSTFKKRIKHYHKDKYIIQYSIFKFLGLFQIWHTLYEWFDVGLGSADVATYNPLLYSVQNAEESIKTVTLDEINTHNKLQRAKQIDFYKREKEYRKRTIPYHSKEY